MSLSIDGHFKRHTRLVNRCSVSTVMDMLADRDRLRDPMNVSFVEDQIRPTAQVCVISSFIYFAIKVLSLHPATMVTWYMIGAPTSMAFVFETMKKYKHRLRVVPTGIFDTFKNTRFDYAIFDSDSHSPSTISVQMCLLLRLLPNLSPTGGILVQSLSPVTESTSSPYTAVWSALFDTYRPISVDSTSRADVMKLRAVFEGRRLGPGPAAAAVARIFDAGLRPESELRITTRVNPELVREVKRLFEGLSAYIVDFGKRENRVPVRPGDARYLVTIRDREHISLCVSGCIQEKFKSNGADIVPANRQDSWWNYKDDYRPACRWRPMSDVLSSIEFLTARRTQLRGAEVTVVSELPLQNVLESLFPEVSRWVHTRTGLKAMDDLKAKRNDQTHTNTTRRFLLVHDLRIPYDLVRSENPDAMLLTVDASAVNGIPQNDELDANLFTARTKLVPKHTCFDGVFDVAGSETDPLTPSGTIHTIPFAVEDTVVALAVDKLPGRRKGTGGGGHRYPVGTMNVELMKQCMLDVALDKRVRNDLQSRSSTQLPLPPIPGHDGGWDCRRYFEIAIAYVKKDGDKQKGAKKGADKKAGDKNVEHAAMRLMRNIDEAVTKLTGGQSLLRCIARNLDLDPGAGRKVPKGVVALWKQMWRTRMREHAGVMRIRLLREGRSTFDATTLKRMMAELDEIDKN